MNMGNIGLVNDNIVFEEDNFCEVFRDVNIKKKYIAKGMTSKCTFKWNINKKGNMELCIHIINIFFTTDIKNKIRPLQPVISKYFFKTTNKFLLKCMNMMYMTNMTKRYMKVE